MQRNLVLLLPGQVLFQDLKKSVLDLFSWGLTSYLTPPWTHMHEARDIIRFRFSLTGVSQEWGWLFLDFVA